MLQQLREKTQGWIAGIIIGVLILSMGLWGISYYLHGNGAAGSEVAKFAGGEISQTELNTAYNRYRMRAGAQDDLSVAAVQGVKQSILQELITQKLLALAAKDNRFYISELQVQSVLNQIPAFQVNGQFSPTQFQNVVNSMLFTVPSFLDNLKDTMLVNQIQSGMLGSAFALPNEAQTSIALVGQQRQFSYAVLDKSRVANSIQVTPAQMQDYYQQHQQQFMVPELVSLQYVTLSADAIMNTLQPTSADLLNFYQANSSNYSQPAQWHVAHILVGSDQQLANKLYQQIKSGKDFSALAQQYSTDALSAKQGGVMPWFSAGQLDPSFETIVSNLQVGQVSQPVQTKYGYEIIKLLAQRPQTTAPYSQVQDKVRKAYLLQKTQQKFADAKDQLANASFEDPNSLAPAAKLLQLQVKTTPLFGKSGAKDGIAKLPQIVSAAFSDDVLAGENSDVITLSPTEVAIVRLSQHQPAVTKPFDTVVPEIKTILTQTATQQALQAQANAITQAYQAGTSAAVLAKQYKFSWQNAPNQARYAHTSVQPIIVQQAFNMPRPNKTATLSRVALPDSSYALVLVNKVTEGNVDKGQISIFSERMDKALGQVEYLEYVKYLHKKANVTTSVINDDND